jgi:hypothetical protein
LRDRIRELEERELKVREPLAPDLVET